MINTTKRNLGLSLKRSIKKINHTGVRIMNGLPPILNTITDNGNKNNNLHVIKWVDKGGFINVAYQNVKPHQFDNINNLINSSSLVFTQNDMDKIAMTIYQTTNDGFQSTNENKVLGTYNYNELTEKFILEQIKQFLDFELVA